MTDERVHAGNPWFSIWTKPRDTIQQIIDSDPQRMVLVLAALGGIGSVLDNASIRSLGDRYDLPVIFGMAAVAGPIGGIIALYLFAALLRWTGSWLGGTADAINIRAAIAWSGVPLIWALLLWIPELMLFGKEVFTELTPRMAADDRLLTAYVAIGVIEIIISIWSSVVYLKCIGQVQGFSAWKALGSAILAALVIAVPLLLLFLPYVIGGFLF